MSERTEQRLASCTLQLSFRAVRRRWPRKACVPWLKRNLFSDWKNTLGTLIVLAVLVRYLPPLLDWAVFNAVARPDNAACRAIGHEGACWGVDRGEIPADPVRALSRTRSSGGRWSRRC